MPDRTEIVILGDVNVDLLARFPAYPREGEDGLATAMDLHCGGSAANTARALARLGLGVRLISRVGSDPWADIVLRSLAEAGVALDGVQRDAEAMTGLIYIVVTPGGERTMLSCRGANTATDPGALSEADFRGARLLHLSGYALLAEPQRSAARRAVDLASAAGLAISLDPGLAAASSDELRALLPRIDLLLPTLAEAQATTGLATAEECARALQGGGGRTVAIKLGRQGSLTCCPEGLFRTPGCAVEAQDSTGAGDAFDAGFLAARLGGLDCRAAAAAANALGALAAAQVGAGTEALSGPAAAALLDRHGTAAAAQAAEFLARAGHTP